MSLFIVYYYRLCVRLRPPTASFFQCVKYGIVNGLKDEDYLIITAISDNPFYHYGRFKSDKRTVTVLKGLSIFDKIK